MLINRSLWLKRKFSEKNPNWGLKKNQVQLCSWERSTVWTIHSWGMLIVAYLNLPKKYQYFEFARSRFGCFHWKKSFSNLVASVQQLLRHLSFGLASLGSLYKIDLVQHTCCLDKRKTFRLISVHDRAGKSDESTLNKPSAKIGMCGV